MTLGDHGVRSLGFPGLLLPVCVSASVRKRILAIFAFGRCVFFTSFLFRFAASTFSRVCVCLFVSTITFLMLVLI